MSHISMSHSDAELASLTVAALKERLRERGLRVSGRKADLIERLSAPLSSPSPGPPPPLPPPPRAPRRPNSARPLVPIDATPRKAGAVGPGARRLRAASWNVAGLRGLLRREEGRSTLRRLVDEEGVDVLMLQETKLQESHVAEVEAALYEALGGGEAWRAAWACSTARKGYAGVSTLWRRRVGDAACRPLSVDPAHEADREGCAAHAPSRTRPRRGVAGCRGPAAASFGEAASPQRTGARCCGSSAGRRRRAAAAAAEGRASS